MKGGIIQDQQATGGKARQELLFQPGIEHLGVTSAFEQQRSDETMVQVATDQASTGTPLSIHVTEHP